MNNWLRHSRWQSWSLWSGVLLLVIGYISEHSWQSLPGIRALETLLLGLSAWVIAVLLRRLPRIALANALLCVFTAALICFISLLPMLAMLLTVAGGLTLGSAVARNDRMPMTSAVAGVGALAGVLGWLLPFPMHYRFVYFSLLLILIVVHRRRCHAALCEGVCAWRTAVNESPAAAAFAVLVVGLASAGCWLPTVQFDDLAYHLGLPSQLATLGYYRMDVHSQIWALAPWSGDIIQAVVQMLAGTEARGAVDAFWLIAAATLTYQLTAVLGAPAFARWLAAALFASLPLSASLAGGMQAELPATAASLALALTIATAPERACLRVVCLCAMLAGFLLGLKAGFIAIIVPLLAWLAWRWRGSWSWKMTVSGLVLAFAVGGSSYVYAALLTGNPLFPLLNGFFHSVLLSGHDFVDQRWIAPVAWDIPWQLTFHTHAYQEGWDGAAGFTLLGLSGAIVVALALPKLRPLALAALIAFLVAIVTVHYFRYTYPALVLLTPVAVTATALVASRRNAMTLLVMLTVLDLAYQSCAYWTLHVGGVKRRLSDWSAESTMERMAPERKLIQTIRQQDPTANVLMCSPDAPFAAELAGRGFVTAWYDPELARFREAAEIDVSGSSWRALFVYTNAQYAIVSTTSHSPSLDTALANAHLLRQIGLAQLWELPAGPINSNELSHIRNLAAAKFWP